MRARASRYYWIILLLVAVLVALVGGWADQKVEQAIQRGLREDLETVLDANVTALRIWMHNQERMASVIAGEPEVREVSVALLNGLAARSVDPDSFVDQPEQANFERTLIERLRGSGFLVAQLVSTNRMIVGFSGRVRPRLGIPVDEMHEAKFDELFASNRAVVITPFKPSALHPPPPSGTGRRMGLTKPLARRETDKKGPGKPGDFKKELKELMRPLPFSTLARRDMTLMQVAAPLRAHNAVIGALAFVLRPEDEFTKVLSVARPGMSGETFAFDQNGLMISQSRFDDQLKELGLLPNSTNVSSALTLELRDPGGDLTKGEGLLPHGKSFPLVPMIEDAVEGGAGVDVEPSRDYRGVPVVGAWRWLPEHGFGVATKIDAEEAYQPLRVLRMTFIVLVGLLAMFALGMLMFSYSNLVWRRKFDEAQLKARQLGQYTLEEKIGEGGMGSVYKARHALLRRETAIKLLPPDQADASSIRQFEREVQLTCQLTHPNTIQVYDYGHTPEGLFYYAMEYLRGLTLFELVSKHGPQPEERVMHILTQAAESLREAHSAGLIHRDIKPSNIFLCERGGVPDTVKVLDFGLVKLVGGENSARRDKAESRGLVGTPRYMAPEIIKHPERADARGDIYALGAVGYFVLTGKPVFDGKTSEAILKSQVNETVIPPRQVTSQPLSEEFERLILRCLEKDPTARPQSAEEFLTLLRQCPSAGAWTPAKRIAWWQQHAAGAAAPKVRETKKIPNGADRTLKIDLAER